MPQNNKVKQLGPILNVEQNLFFDFWDFWFGEEFGVRFCQIVLKMAENVKQKHNFCSPSEKSEKKIPIFLEIFGPREISEI